MWVWTSTTPGSTRSPGASTTSRAVDAGPDRSGSIAVIRPPSTATSATREPAAVTTVPPRTTRSATVSSLRDLDLLGALPEAPPPDLAQPLLPALVGQDRREVVRRQLADLRRRRARAVREEDLALADAARVEREVAGRRVRRVVLPADVRPQVAVRDPRRLAAPAAVDQPGAQGQHRPDDLDRLRGLGLPAGVKCRSPTRIDSSLIGGGYGARRPPDHLHARARHRHRAARVGRSRHLPAPRRRPGPGCRRRHDRRRRPDPRRARRAASSSPASTACRSSWARTRFFEAVDGRRADRGRRAAATTSRCSSRRSG